MLNKSHMCNRAVTIQVPVDSIQFLTFRFSTFRFDFRYYVTDDIDTQILLLLTVD